jgi:GNAT superfamily N-acetyltransferase
MEDAIGRARGLGCYRVQLTSNAARSDAHRFYGRLGFVPTHVGFKMPLD